MLIQKRLLIGRLVSRADQCLEVAEVVMTRSKFCSQCLSAKEKFARVPRKSHLPTQKTVLGAFESMCEQFVTSRQMTQPDCKSQIFV